MGVQNPLREGALLRVDMYQRVDTYLCMSVLSPPRATVPAQRTRRTNAFAAATTRR